MKKKKFIITVESINKPQKEIEERFNKTVKYALFLLKEIQENKGITNTHIENTM